MNEELKIIITAVTDPAKKKIKEVNGEINKIGSGSKKAGGTGAKAMAALAKGAAVAVGAVAVVATAIVAVGAALVGLGKSTMDYNKEQAKLITAFQASGASAAQAAESYKSLYRFLGDSGKATEAAAHLAKITTNQEHLAEWSKIAQGVYASFGDSLPIEGLTEAANETIRVGKVTGTMADALNWAGVSEDEFNAKLAQTTTLEEREALTRATLTGLYEDAANAYEKNNKALLDYNESQANLDAIMGEAGKAVMPLMTALNNMSTALFTALKPAIEAVIPYLVSFVEMITKALYAVMGFFGVVTGQSASIKTVGASIGQASKGANTLSTGLGGAAKNAEKVKKSTQGFDELNIVGSGSGSSGSSGSGSGAPAYATGAVGAGGGFGIEMVEGEKSASGFSKMLEAIKTKLIEVGSVLATVFAPAIQGWSEAWNSIKTGFEASIPYFIEGFTSIGNGLLDLATWYIQYCTDVINSFSANIAPIAGDIIGFLAEEIGVIFAFLGEKINLIINEIIIPAFDFIKLIITDSFTILSNTWNEYGQPLMDALSAFIEQVKLTIDNLLNSVILPIWNKILEVLNDIWVSALQPLVQKVTDAVTVIATEILIFYNQVLSPIINWIITNILPPVVKVVNGVIEFVGKLFKAIAQTISGVIDVIKGIIQFIVGVFTADWQKAWDGIKNIFIGLWETIKGVVNTAIAIIEGILIFVKDVFVAAWKIAWETVKGVFTAVWNWIKKAASDAWNAIKKVFEPVGKFFTDIWNKVKNVFANVVTWFRDKFKAAWEAIKKVFSGVGSFFGGIWNTISSKFTAIGTKIGDAISKSVKKGINGVISAIEKIINSGISLINGAIELINMIPGVSVGKIKKLSLPRLAKGGIVDSATVAMIGEAGKEAVVPLENNTEWMDKLAEKLAARNNTPTRIVLKLNERELGWATINAINGITTTTGGLQLAL